MSEVQRLSELQLLRAQLEEAVSRREAIKAKIHALQTEKASIHEAEAHLRLKISRLGGGFDARGMSDPPMRPQRLVQGSWIDEAPA